MEVGRTGAICLVLDLGLVFGGLYVDGEGYCSVEDNVHEVRTRQVP